MIPHRLHSNPVLRLAMILLVSLPFFSIGQTKLNSEKPGFRNYIFGSSPLDYKNLILDIDQGRTKLYSVNEPELKVNNVVFESIRLTFWENKLAAISLETKNSTGDVFLKTLITHYGNPHKADPKNKVFEWHIKTMDLIYEKAYSGKDASVYYYSKP